uniref:Uncharacterized protein n=1 Tax=Cacopsylla melanoneura TaxID=428564 RepID=A0A8D8XGR0_9HEMI
MASLSALSEINRSPAQYQCYPAQHCIPRVCHWIEHMVVRMVRRYESGDQWDAGPGQKRPVSRCVRGVRIGTSDFDSCFRSLHRGGQCARRPRTAPQGAREHSSLLYELLRYNASGAVNLPLLAGH